MNDREKTNRASADGADPNSPAGSSEMDANMPGTDHGAMKLPESEQNLGKQPASPDPAPGGPNVNKPAPDGPKAAQGDAPAKPPPASDGMDMNMPGMDRSKRTTPENPMPVASADGREEPSGSSAAGMEGMDHSSMAGMPGVAMGAPKVSGPEIAAVATLSLLALAAGVLISAASVNLNLSARDVGGLRMPPGMIMTRETSADAMRDMAAVNARDAWFTAPIEARGDRTIEPRLEGGVKVFDLETSVIRWNILPAVQVSAYAVNNQVPGPRIRLTQGDRVRFNLKNNLPVSTTIHWHGLILPNAMDGPAGITQKPIAPGERFTYAFTVNQVGTYFYHSHDNSDRQQALGLYGALIVDPKLTPARPEYDLEYTVQLQEWLARDGLTYPAMLMEGGLPNYFTINGKAYPATEAIEMKVGQKLLLRFIGSNNNFVHPMHVHGGPFTVVARDGETIQPSARFKVDTVNVGPGQRYDVIWTARSPGAWLLHCHIPHHTTNNNAEEQGGGGLTMLIKVSG